MRISKETLVVLFSIILVVGIDILVFKKLEISIPIEPLLKIGISVQIGSLLNKFIIVLATVSALIFPLFFRSSREGIDYARSDEKYVVGYLCMFILGILVSLFTLVGIIELTDLVFKLSLILFLDCLILLPPFIFIFIRVNILRVMERVRNSILDELDPIPFIRRRVKLEGAKEKINDLKRIILQALSDHNYIALDYGIKRFMEISYEITRKTQTSNGFIKKIIRVFRRTEISTENGNLLVREIMRNFRDLGIACVKDNSDEYARQIGKNMRTIIMNGLDNQKNFEYPNFIPHFEKLGIEAARKHLEEATDEILHSLGQIGDRSIKTMDLQRPPIFAVLKSLQNVGIVCAKEKMAHQCATARTRILGIARLGKQGEQENIFHEALKRFWVVTAYMYTNIPEIEEANYKMEKTLKEEFGNIFVQTIDEAIEMLHIESEWEQERIVKEFKSTFEFLRE
ncbi:MAG: hypothetical protein HXS48_12915 [Theionarchaea archaeon]|nr:hypothetical protein [Theionarchaea archaeon]